MKLWDKVESALVGGIADAQRTFIKEVAEGNYSADEIVETGRELNLAIQESDALKKQYG